LTGGGTLRAVPRDKRAKPKDIPAERLTEGNEVITS